MISLVKFITEYCSKLLGKSGELRYGDGLKAPKPSSLFKSSIYLSSLFLLFSSAAHSAIYFLPDVQLDIVGAVSEDASRCEELGYSYYASGQCPEYHNQDTCVFSDKYLKCDDIGWCLDNGYTNITCIKPQYLTNQCPNMLSYYQSCTTDYERACKEENSNYVNTCSSGWMINPDTTCTYSSSWGFCCNKCDGYTETNSTPPQYYELAGECASCEGTRYKFKAAACPSGYTSGLTSCSGSGYTYSSNGYAGDKKCGKCTAKSCPSGYSTSVTSCSSGYTFSTNGYSGDKKCGMCTANSTGCPSGYVDYSSIVSNKGPQYFNYTSGIILNEDYEDWCVPSSNVYLNSSVSSLYSGDYIYKTGTYNVSGYPLIRTQTSSGTLTINGNVAVDAVFLMNSSAKLVINGTAVIKQAVYLKTGAKFCPSSIDTSIVTYHSARGYRWCVKDWSGFGDSKGSGSCDFDGECYY